MARRRVLSFLLLLLGAITGCSGHKQAKIEVPPPPPPAPAATPSPGLAAKPAAPAEIGGEDSGEAFPSIPENATPLLTETGLASWYGAPYHNRRGSNGEIYNMHAMTAAHRTLPLGSIVRVTNEKTGHSALLRITDRGPFVEGRILDVSYAAAQRLDIWQPGVAAVKVEVLQTPVPLSTGGKWAVQIGKFEDPRTAADLAEHLARRYQTAKVAKFNSPTGDWWVRVRVLNDDRQRAEALARETETPQGAVYLVRLD
jgi:rare lipoprotein A